MLLRWVSQGYCVPPISFAGAQKTVLTLRDPTLTLGGRALSRIGGKLLSRKRGWLRENLEVKMGAFEKRRGEHVFDFMVKKFSDACENIFVVKLRTLLCERFLYLLRCSVIRSFFLKRNLAGKIRNFAMQGALRYLACRLHWFLFKEEKPLWTEVCTQTQALLAMAARVESMQPKPEIPGAESW